MIPEIYGVLHKYGKKIVKRSFSECEYSFYTINHEVIKNNTVEVVGQADGAFFNHLVIKNDSVLIAKEECFPVENAAFGIADSMYLTKESNQKRSNKPIKYAMDLDEAFLLWKRFVENSRIKSGYKYGDLHFAGYIHETNQWCLPSWIWTNAAVVRYYCRIGEIDKAVFIGNQLLSYQENEGGWIVRNDYDNSGAKPILAPNDSAYIAINSSLVLFEKTKELSFLKSAVKCAEWIMLCTREDGLVYYGYDVKSKYWIKDKNIVDIGFTAGLFAGLFKITAEKKYLVFLKKFIRTYIDVFYIEEEKCFATAIGKSDVKRGGTFGRGQAWALEGLIPAYEVLRDFELKRVIENTINTLLNRQKNDGSWAYNLSKPIMGKDCKAVSIIASCLVRWCLNYYNEDLLSSAQRALDWCAKNTSASGAATGGIFSYTIEGAIVRDMYTKTAFVYSSAYAVETTIEIEKLLGRG